MKKFWKISIVIIAVLTILGVFFGMFWGGGFLIHRFIFPKLPITEASFTIFFLFIIGLAIINGISNKRERKKRELIGCRTCYRIERIHPEIPYCQTCLEEAFEEIDRLVSEAEKRIKLSRELGLNNQTKGAKKWFWENLPEPIKWFLEQEVLNQLKEAFPQAKPFDPLWFDEYPLDTTNPELNIPQEGLEILAKIIKGQKQLLPEVSQ